MPFRPIIRKRPVAPIAPRAPGSAAALPADGISSIANLATPVLSGSTILLALATTGTNPKSVPFDCVRVSGCPHVNQGAPASADWTWSAVTGMPDTYDFKPATALTLTAASPPCTLPFTLPPSDSQMYMASFTLYHGNVAVSNSAPVAITPSTAVTLPVISVGAHSPAVLILANDPKGFPNALTCHLRPDASSTAGVLLSKVELIAWTTAGVKVDDATMNTYLSGAKVQTAAGVTPITTTTFNISGAVTKPVMSFDFTGIALPPTAARLEVRFSLTTSDQRYAYTASAYFETYGPITLDYTLSADDTAYYQLDSPHLVRCFDDNHKKPNITWTLKNADGTPLNLTLYSSLNNPNASATQGGSDPKYNVGQNILYWLLAPNVPVISKDITLVQITPDTVTPNLSGFDLRAPHAPAGQGNTLQYWSKLNDAKFIGTDLTNLNLNGKNLYSADFTNAKLAGADLSSVNLCSALFSATTFSASTKLNNLRAAEGMQNAGQYIGLYCPYFSGCDLSAIQNTNCQGMTLVIREDGTNKWPAFMSLASLINTDVNKKIAMFAGMTIGGCPLAGVSFAGMNFTGIDSNGKPIGIDFTGINLSGCDFTGATLNNATFKNTTFSADTKFTNATATNVTITNCDLSALTSANCQGLQLQFTDGGGNTYPAFWRLATSKASSASKFAIFPGAKLLGLPLTNTSFANLNLATGSIACDFTGLDLTGCDFTSAVIAGVNFSRANLSGANLTNCMFLQGGSTIPVFNNTTFSATTNLTNAQAAMGCSALPSGLQGPSFTNCDLSSIPLTNCQGMTLVIKDGGGNTWPTGVSFASLNPADSTQKIAMFAGMKVGGCPLANVSFADMNLSGIDFTGINLTGCIFTGTTLTGTHFTGADLTSAYLGNVIVAPCYFSSTTTIPAANPGLAQAIKARARNRAERGESGEFLLSGGCTGTGFWTEDIEILGITVGSKPRQAPWGGEVTAGFRATDSLPSVMDGANVQWG